ISALAPRSPVYLRAPQPFPGFALALCSRYLGARSALTHLSKGSATLPLLRPRAISALAPRSPIYLRAPQPFPCFALALCSRYLAARPALTRLLEAPAIPLSGTRCPR